MKYFDAAREELESFYSEELKNRNSNQEVI